MPLQTKEFSQTAGIPQTLPPSLPPLKTGQRLSRVEFERRYETHPEIKKAELIEGVVYVASPVRIKHHSRPHFDIIGWLNLYRLATPGIWGGDNGTLQLDDQNEYQPDAWLSLEPELGGRSHITPDDYLAGAPELVVEIAGSSARKDMRDKRLVYARHGVPEYLVAQTESQEISWFILQQGVYQPLAADENGMLRSHIFPGLWLDPAAFWAGDMGTVLATLQQGLASPEHTAFVEQLRRRMEPPK